jgi:hypothetical protein
LRLDDVGRAPGNFVSFADRCSAAISTEPASSGRHYQPPNSYLYSDAGCPAASTARSLSFAT